VAETVARKMGYSSVPWFKLTWVLLWMYAGLTNLVLFYRQDFINLTVCVVALYMMFNTERITRGRFRMLVLGIILSLIYDLVWFYLKHHEYSDEKSDTGSEKNLKKFSLMMSYASFILRVSEIESLNLGIDLCGFSILERLDGLRQDHSEQRRTGCLTTETEHRP
jgi:hypothetical protein